MEYQDLLAKVGDDGGFQVIMAILLCIANLWSTIANMGVNFLSPSQDHWCAPPPQLRACSQAWYDAFIPSSSSCEIHSVTGLDTMTCDDVINLNVTSHNVSECLYGVEFDTTIRTTTATSEWDLVCEKEWVQDLISPVYAAGLLVGAMSGGILADKFGRLFTLVMFTCLHILSGIAVAFSTDEWMYMIFRAVLGGAQRAILGAALVLLMEVVSSRYRVEAVMVFTIFLSSGTLILTGVAYFIRTFRELQLILIAPLSILIVTYWGFVPESPCWLMSKGKTDDAARILTKIAAINNKPISEETILMDTEEVVHTLRNRQEKARFSDLVLHQVIRKYTLVTTWITVTSQFIYFAVSFNIDSLFGDVYLNSAVTSMIDIPSYLLAGFFMQRLGRKPPLLFNLCLAAVLAAICIPLQLTEHFSAVTWLSLLTRSAMSCNIYNTQIFIGELFPTSVRQMALGFNNMVAATASIFSPYVGGHLKLVYSPLPYIIYVTLALLAAILATMLPETLDESLPGTLSDAANIGRHRPVDESGATGYEGQKGHGGPRDDGGPRGYDGPMKEEYAMGAAPYGDVNSSQAQLWPPTPQSDRSVPVTEL